MKTRTSLVSNSSTSSFICEICGGMEAGSDSLGAEEYGFIILDCGHEFHIDCLSNEDNEDCLVCSFKIVGQTDIINYLRWKNPKFKEEILEEMKQKFLTYEEMKKALKKK